MNAKSIKFFLLSKLIAGLSLGSLSLTSCSTLKNRYGIGKRPMEDDRRRNTVAKVRRLSIDGTKGFFGQDAEGRNAIHRAASSNQADMLADLLQQSFEGYGTGQNNPIVPLLNARDNDGYAPLHLAARGGYETAVQMLIQHPKIDVNIRNRNGHTSLHLAAGRGDTAVVQMLTQHAANVNIQDINGATPLHLAATNGHAEVINMLLN